MIKKNEKEREREREGGVIPHTNFIITFDVKFLRES